MCMPCHSSDPARCEVAAPRYIHLTREILHHYFVSANSMVVARQVATSVLGTAPALEQPLMEAGLDSLGAVELRNGLATLFAVELPATVTFDHPTSAALGIYIAGSCL